MQAPENVAEPRASWRAKLIGTPLGWALTVGLAAIGIYLFATHPGHVFSALPYLLLLLCPVMHLFGHGKHRHGDHQHGKT